MPLPTPKKGETEKKFISRCMSSETIQEEFSDQKQRIAVCYSQWRGKSSAKKDVEKEDGHSCVCPKCGHVVEVELGHKCNEVDCSECGTRMIQKSPGVNQAKESILRVYRKEDEDGTWQDRWIAVSTKEMWDADGEMFTKEAMDYDSSKAEETGEYPEFRLYHVRGFKLGKCDSMSRVGEYAVDQGYWYDTPLALAMKEIVSANEGRWKISRGFHAVEASGLCPDCGVGLTVRPLNFIVGAPCPACRTWLMPSKLKQLKHLKARTFDITLTDVPAVSATAVAAYSITS